MSTLELHPFSQTAETFIAVELGRITYTSQEHGLKPLLEFMAKFPGVQELVIFDNVIGQAAAKLLALVKPKVIYGLVGTTAAAKILTEASLDFHFSQTTPKLNMPVGTEDYEVLAQSKTPAELLSALSGGVVAKGKRAPAVKKAVKKTVVRKTSGKKSKRARV